MINIITLLYPDLVKENYEINWTKEYFQHFNRYMLDEYEYEPEILDIHFYYKHHYRYYTFKEIYPDSKK